LDEAVKRIEVIFQRYQSTQRRSTILPLPLRERESA
jgi:hypothetical protein